MLADDDDQSGGNDDDDAESGRNEDDDDDAEKEKLRDRLAKQGSLCCQFYTSLPRSDTQ